MAESAVEKFDQDHDFDQYIGQLDLDTHPKWNQAWETQDKELFEKIIHYFGADITQGYLFEQVLYRARRTDLTPSQQVEHGLVVRFKERTDAWWVKHMMSIEDIVRHTQNSIRATGMRQCMNEDTPMNDVMMEQAAKMLVVVDIKCNDEKEVVE